MAKKRKISGRELLRILGGIVLLYLCIAGIRNAIASYRSDSISIAIAILTGLVCIVFLLIGLVMVFGWLSTKED